MIASTSPIRRRARCVGPAPGPTAWCGRWSVQGLFDFGDRDGIGKRAILQHVQCVAVGRGELFIADTYNHRIKRIELATGEVMSIAGDGKAGAYDGRGARARFNEPAGIAWAEGRLYVADTNNHAIRVVDLGDPDYGVSTIEISGV